VIKMSIIQKPVLLVSLVIIVLILLVGGCSSGSITSIKPISSTPPNKTSTASSKTTVSGKDITFSLKIANKDIKTGQSFTIDVVIESKLALRSGQCGLNFDPTLMKCEKVEEGSFFKDWASKNGAITMVLPQPSIDNSRGSVSTQGIAVMGSTVSGGVNGEGILCTYNFTALKDGTISPKLNDVVVGVMKGEDLIDYTDIRIIN
jgi:hypothetical protein